MMEARSKGRSDVSTKHYKFGPKWYTYTKKLTTSLYPDIIFTKTSPKTYEKEFSETRGFSTLSSETFKILVKNIADYIKYKLDISGDILLDYDPELDEVFIKIRSTEHKTPKEKVDLENYLVRKVFRKFDEDEAWNITILVE